MLALAGAGAAWAAGYDEEPGGLTASSSTLARVRAVYERAHAHDYTRAATVLEEWRIFQDGTVGSYKVNRIGRDVRETTILGPLTYERGVLHGVHWEQNRNGITFTYPGVHEQRETISDHAFRDPTDERDVRLVGDSQQFGAYVVEINPPGGRREWLYLDKHTGFVVRKEWIARVSSWRPTSMSGLSTGIVIAGRSVGHGASGSGSVSSAGSTTIPAAPESSKKSYAACPTITRTVASPSTNRTGSCTDDWRSGNSTKRRLGGMSTSR